MDRGQRQCRWPVLIFYLLIGRLIEFLIGLAYNILAEFEFGGAVLTLR